MKTDPLPGRTRRFRLALLIAGVALLPLLVISLQLTSGATRDASEFSSLFIPLLLINLAGLVALAVLIGIQGTRLLLDFKARRPGARLTLRIAVMLGLVALVPQGVLLWFSLDLLRHGIDSWFDLEIEDTMQDALTLSRISLELNMRGRLHDTLQVTKSLAVMEEEAVPFEVDNLRVQAGASDLTLFSGKAAVIFSSSADTSRIVPVGLSNDVLLQLRQGNPYIGLDPLQGMGVRIRIAARVGEAAPGQERRILQALYPVPEEIDQLTGGIQRNLDRYRQLDYLRPRLNFNFVLVLILVSLATLFSSAWLAFLGARRLVAPIVELARGTEAVARGRYDLRLPTSRRAELGFLLNSFNEMTSRLEQARAAEQDSRAQAENQHAYLEAVLGCLSSGVLVFDGKQQLRAANGAADHLLDAPIRSLLGGPPEAWGQHHPHLQSLLESMLPLLRHGVEWRRQVEMETRRGHRVLLCTGTALGTPGTGAREHVVVMDDITQLLRTQRIAAWSEVARRLAHEIKNPLTPIRLAAEHLRHKCLPLLPEQQADSLSRLTGTIIEQVRTMQRMVDAFSEYAKAPRLEFAPLDLNRLVKESAELYRGMRSDLRLELDLGTPAQPQADERGLRQVLNNLLNNALEAGVPGRTPCVCVTTRARGALVELSVRDNGAGLPQELLGHAFEPYVTTKEKGTGLGLAIVLRIVEEHGGSLQLENNQPPPGAEVRVLLPLRPPEKRYNVPAPITLPRSEEVA